ncbi:MAG TPA: DUF4424 family protein [Candidatus Acidoferrales bacterium]|jgi:hypothetical protein|nr:DUF4424 family protein [Candidatus Acidoferrales bacterium]
MPRRVTKTLFIILLTLSSGLSGRADDSAVSVAAGGVRLSREAHISMEKEILRISDKTVAVDFDFLNESDSGITTEVGFPIPPYKFGEWGDPGWHRDFQDFRVWVDGRKIDYQSDVRAKLDGKEYTELLRRLGFVIDFALNDDADDLSSQLEKTFAGLGAVDRNRLLSLGLIKAEKGRHLFEWSVYKEYHWTQTFPAHKMVHIRHEYTPEVGFQPVELRELQTKFPNACIDQALENQLKADVAGRSANEGRYVYLEWVDYILTSANSWKTPIKSFELIVEGPKLDKDHHHYYASFCWDGPVVRRDADHFTADVNNFVPRHELRIYFFPAE